MEKSELPVGKLNKVAADFNGRMGFYIEDLNTGLIHQHNQKQRFPTASVCKITVLIELFRQVEEGQLSLDQRHRLEGNVSTHGSGTLSLMKDGPEMTLLDYSRMMIAVSDNIATDTLINILGTDCINATLDKLGFPNTRTSVTIGRYHYRMAGLADDVPCSTENDALYKQAIDEAGGPDFSSLSYQDSLENNVATPADMGAILKQLHQGSIVTPAASAAMIELLKTCQDRRMLAHPVARGISIAHKSGSSGRIKGDVGIIFLPTGPLIVSAFALAADSDVNGGEAIAQISRLAVEACSPASINAV
jgi:beta-lactamase class A